MLPPLCEKEKRGEAGWPPPSRKRHASFQILLLRAATAQRAHVDVVVPTRQGVDHDFAHVERGFGGVIGLHGRWSSGS